MTDKNPQVKVTINPLPIESARKFSVNFQISQKTIKYENSTAAQASPVANKIFGFPWTEWVEVGTDYVTVTKQDWVNWEALSEPLAEIIKEHFESKDRSEVIEENLDLFPSDVTADPQAAQIQQVLENEINPAVAAHGGRISLIDFKEGTAYIKMGGGCQGCGQADATLKQGVETTLKARLPFVLSVLDTTDHADGKNPYFQP
jgi:Fe-S cluster biogenesis protein NfuA